MKDLEMLGLHSTQITDAGLKDLEQALPKTKIRPPNAIFSD